MAACSSFAPQCTPEKGIWPPTTWPDAAPSWDFRNLWLATARGDTSLARARISGLQRTEIPRRGMRRRHTEVALNGYRLHRHLAISLVIAGGLLLLSGCQGLAGSSSGTGSVGLGSGSLNFGSVPIGSSKTLSDTITNGTSSSVTISSIQGSGSGFQVTGITTPLVLAAGQSASFSVQFQPAASGDPTITISFDGPNAQPYASLSATATAVTLGKLSPSPASVAFGNIGVGANQTSTVTLSNSGQTSLTITSATLSGAGFSMSNLDLPLTLTAGTSTSTTITFAPTGIGNFSGSVTFATTSDSVNNNVVLNFSGAGVTAGTLTPNASSLAFGGVQVGSNSSLSETLTNTGGTTITISQATASGAGFSISGLTLPVTLAANQSVTFTATFAPASAGAASGTLSIVSNASNSLSIPLSGTALAAGALIANPASANFGNVTVGNNQTLPVTVTNTGGESVTVSNAAATGSGFSVTGPNPPITLNAGQGATFNVIFTPSATGAASGALTINSTASNASLSVPLSGTGVAQGQLGSNPTSFSFGNTQVGTSNSLSGTLTNSGGTSLKISAAAASGTGFSLSGLSLPVTLNAGQSTSFTVFFGPTASGAASGSVSITSTGSNPNLSIPLSGTGVAPGVLAANPTSLAFTSTQVGNSTNLSETLTNTGGSTVSISQANVTGAGFSISGLSGFPINLTANQTVTFTATFRPTSAGAASGNLSVVSNASNSTLNIALSGTGTAAGQLAVSPTSLSFGNVVDGSSSPITGSLLTASGASVTVLSASISGANGSEFALSGISLPVTLSAGQSASFTVTFTPGASGAASASLSFSSTASNSPAVQSMTGTGTAATQHTVDLTWDTSTGAVSYNIYRGTVSGGPYPTMINTSPDSTTAYTDSTVVSGTTYYYVVTAVNASSEESGYSNQATAVIPTP